MSDPKQASIEAQVAAKIAATIFHGGQVAYSAEAFAAVSGDVLTVIRNLAAGGGTADPTYDNVVQAFPGAQVQPPAVTLPVAVPTMAAPAVAAPPAAAAPTMAAPVAAAPPVIAGAVGVKTGKDDDLWRELLASWNGSEFVGWWDNRAGKTGNGPDFKNKDDGDKALWTHFKGKISSSVPDFVIEALQLQ